MCCKEHHRGKVGWSPETDPKGQWTQLSFDFLPPIATFYFRFLLWQIPWNLQKVLLLAGHWWFLSMLKFSVIVSKEKKQDLECDIYIEGPEEKMGIRQLVCVLDWNSVSSVSLQASSLFTSIYTHQNGLPYNPLCSGMFLRITEDLTESYKNVHCVLTCCLVFFFCIKWTA